MDPRIRSGTVRPARARCLLNRRLSSASDMSPKHPLIPSCSYTNAIRYLPGTCQANETLDRNNNPCSGQTSYGIIGPVRQRARPPAKEHQAHPIPLIASPWAQNANLPRSPPAPRFRPVLSRWRVSGRDTEPACACQILTRCQRH